jgi:hypothetical protein
MPKENNPDRRRRHGVSDRERKAIHEKKREFPEWTQKRLAIWATDKFRQPIRQSLISDSLKEKFRHVSGQSKTSVDLGQSNSTAPEILDCPGGFKKSQATRTKRSINECI